MRYVFHSVKEGDVMAVRGSHSGRPIMRLLDVLGQRWVLRILWELRDGPMSFRAVQAACDGISPAVLNDRVKLLRGHDLVALGPDGYALTARAYAVVPLILQMMALADGWAAAGDWPEDGD
jgi:DNA-binding HxlR family transcriptional regulator